MTSDPVPVAHSSIDPPPLLTRQPPQWARDVVTSLAVILLGAVPVTTVMGLQWRGAVLAVNAAACLLLLARRRWPLPTLATTAALVAVTVPLGVFNTGIVVALAVAMYTAVSAINRQTGFWLALALAVGVVACSAFANTFAPQQALIIMLGGALGEASRSQRQHLAAVTERAERAERTREAEARQRVAEDRLVIARDLHDVVAHQIAVINLHAGVASAAVRTRPDDAAASLTIVRTAAQSVLREIGDLLTALRDPQAAGTGPAGLARLEDLVRKVAVDGFEVEVRTEGNPTELPGRIDVVAYRVVQEALTNARKHASAPSAELTLHYAPTGLTVTVTNAVDGDAPGIGNRQGLIGMAERIASVRGTLSYGRADDGDWHLRAQLPFQGHQEGEAP